MRVILPATIAEAQLVSSSAPDLDYAAWSPSSAYAVGAKVTRSVTGLHRNYECIVAVSAGPNAAPELDPTRWGDLDMTNRWQMLDIYSNKQAVVASPLVVEIAPGVRVDSIYVAAETDAILVEVIVGGVVKYSEPISMRGRDTLGWRDFFYGEISYRSAAARLNLPPYIAAHIRITMTRSSGNIKVGAIVVGQAVYIGKTEQGAGSDVTDYGEVNRDKYSNATFNPRKTVPKNTLSLTIENARVNKVYKVRDQLASRPAVWLGVENNAHLLFDSLAMLGFYRRWPFEFKHNDHSVFTLEIEGI